MEGKVHVAVRVDRFQPVVPPKGTDPKPTRFKCVGKTSVTLTLTTDPPVTFKVIV